MAQSRRKGRSGAALLVSAAVHGVLLILLSRAVPILPNLVREPPFQIELVPAFAPPRTEAQALIPELTTPEAEAPVGATPRRRVRRQPAPIRPALVEQRPAPRPAASRPAAAPSPTVTHRAVAASADRPAPASGSGQRPAQAAAGQGSTSGPQHAPAALPGDEYAGGVRQFLRETVGCSHQDFVHLTVAERNECERQNGVQASIGGRQRLDPVPAAKRGYYNSVQQAYQSLHHYDTPLDTGAGGQGASAPGHGPSFGCIHGKCGVISPEGVLTEESGTEPH